MALRPSRDRGQAFPIYVVMVAGLLFLAFAFFAVGQASATRNGAQGAADAAALAAAQDARDELQRNLLETVLAPGSKLPLDLLEDLLNGNGFGAGQGCAEAQRFAARNESDVTGCTRTQFPDDGYTVEVKTRYTVGTSVVPGTETKHATAEATAVLKPRCSLELADRPGNKPPDDGKGEDEGKIKLPITLKCDLKDLTIDPKNLDIFPSAADLFTVRLAD